MSSDLRIRFSAAPASLRIDERVAAAGRPPRRPPRRRDAADGEEPSDAAAEAESEDAPAAADVSLEAPDASDASEERPVDGPPPAWALQLDRFDRVMAKLEAEASRLQGSVGEALVALEPDLVRLALAAAAKVLRRTFDDGQEELARLVGDALQRVVHGIEPAEPIRVIVAPTDHEALAEAVGARANVEFVPDPEHPEGTVDVRCGLRRIGLDVAQEIDRLADRLLGDGDRDE